jgi:glycosyltransferase involved in cell wall biosynthesis
LAGDTHDKGHRDTLRRRMEELGVADAVVWTGWLPTTEAWRYLRAAEVGLSPFPRSPLLDSCSPTKAVEYMAFGLPVLVNDQPDQAKVVAESGAGECVSLSAAAFADSLFGLLNTSTTLETYRGLGRDYVAAKRSYQVISEYLADAYRGLVPGDAARATPRCADEPMEQTS